MYFTSLQFVNVSNLKTKNISWIKSTLISFNFANKDSITRKTSSKFHALCKHIIRFFGELSFRKGKVCYSWIIINFCRVIKMKFYRFIAAFLFFILFYFFLKDMKLKELAVALKFLTVLSLNSNVFCLFYLLVKIPFLNLQREGTTLNLRI